MKVQIDELKFDALQMEVAYAITHEVYTAMKLAGVPDSAQLEEIVAKALFGIGALLDGSHVLEGPDGPTEVMLTFRTAVDKKTLISAGGGSWIMKAPSVSPKTISTGSEPKLVGRDRSGPKSNSSA